MYSTEKANPLTLDYLLKYTTEYDIYLHYIGSSFKIGRVISSPIRKDIHPSFSIFKSDKTGYLLYKDLATNKSGNCIHFVAELLNISYMQALTEVRNKILTGQLYSSVQGVIIKKEYENISKIFSVKRRYFCETDHAFWYQFKITKENLKEYNIMPIDSFWINGEQQPFYYSKTQPMYAFQVFNKFKIYRPLSSKNEKWRTSCTSYDIQGWEQLPKEHINTLFITKSLKDVICLKNLGYTAIAPNGEGHNIPDKVLEKIESIADNVIMFYDRDITGVLAVRKFLKKHKYNFIFIPKKYKVKDISDFIKEYGMEEAKNLLCKLLNGKDKKR